MGSATAKRRSPPDKPRKAPVGRARYGTQEQWIGVLLVVAGMVFMWPAASDAVSPNYGSSPGFDESLRGTPLGEVLTTAGGADEIYGGSGRDTLLSGAGDDFVEAGDGERDFVSCGSGVDVANTDLEDLVSRDCETVFAS